MSQLIGYLDAPPMTAAGELRDILAATMLYLIWAGCTVVGIPAGVIMLIIQALRGK